MSSSPITADRGTAADRNEVILVGRLSGHPERRELPSGDELVAVRVVVRRDDGRADTVDVELGTAPARGRRRRADQLPRRALATVERLATGSRVEVTGALRRRWWQAGSRRVSRTLVQAATITALDDEVGPASAPSAAPRPGDAA